MTDPQTSYKIKRDWLTMQKRIDREGTVIEMRLTYEEWAQVWMDSGHWGQWGNRKGQYCMSRVDDLGHYELGNVFIQPFGENTAEQNRRRAGLPGHNRGGAKTAEGFQAIADNGFVVTQLDYTCPHCNKVGKGPGMYRWHFDKCKHK